MSRAGLASCMIVAGLLLGGCGHASVKATAAKPAEEPLVYIWRNFEYTGIPEEMSVFADGEIRYRNLLHTQSQIKVVRARLSSARLQALRRQLARVDLSRAKATGVKPRRSGFRYIVRSHGEAGTAADGHLRGTMGALVRTLAAEMDRVQGSSLYVQR